MSPALQAKLLRAIDEKTVTRVGGTNETPIGARVVAATNMDLDCANARACSGVTCCTDSIQFNFSCPPYAAGRKTCRS